MIPLVPVMSGMLAVEPRNPPFVMFPWVWEVGVRASESLASLPMQTVVPVEPVGMREMSNVPLVTSAAAWVWVVGVLASDRRESFPWQNVPAAVPNEPA